MASQYNGQAGNIAIPGSLSINLMTGTGVNPTVLFFAAPHGLSTGDLVNVSQVDGNTNANGIWPITVINATQFSIPVTGNGSYGGPQGLATPLTMGQTFQVPSPGDGRKAASVNTGFEALADRTAKLVSMTGARKLVALQINETNNPPSVVSTWASAATSSTAWTVAAGGPLPILLLNTGVIQNDIVEVSVTSSISIAGAAGTVSVSIGYAIAPVLGTFTPIKLPGSGVYMGTAGGGFCCHGAVSASATGNLKVYVGCEANVAGATTTNWVGDYEFVIKVWRPTGANQ